MGTAARYRAFISYSHRDSREASALHRRLERYALPRRLVGTPGRFGPVPRRLAPIFRDLDDLPAADSLSAAVQAALAQSETLVVLCSPAAAASPWVAREIELFRALHPDRPVLAALLSGLPEAAFPAPLLAGGLEPLAADLSTSGKGGGRRLGTLKLVAGITGVALDDLVQRDVQRRLRRVTAITALIAGFGIVMAAMAIFAFDARNEADRRRAEAQRQRAEAEGLVDFMLTDLRDRLKPAGRLDVLDAANRRALGYFAGQDLAQLSPAMLERRAAGLHNLAEDEAEKKQWRAADAAAAEAFRTTQALLAAAPADPDRLFLHAQSIYWQAAVAQGRGDLDAAQRGLVDYDRLGRQLLAAQPGALRSLREAAFGAGNLCDIGIARRQRTGLVATCERSLAMMTAAASRQPEDIVSQLRIVNRQAWLADALYVTGNVPGAHAVRRQQEQLLMQLAAAHPDDRRVERDYLSGQRALAYLEQDLGRDGAARARRQQTVARLERLAAGNPASRMIADNLAALRREASAAPRTVPRKEMP
jgi:MTH538 TIR-like domain (DUF1863)